MDNNISIKEIEPESKRKSTYRSRVIDSYNGMKEAKIWFWATFIGLAVNIALSFTDMIEVENAYKIIIGSILQFIGLAEIALVLTGISLLCTALPLVLGRPYKRRYLICNYLFMTLQFLNSAGYFFFVGYYIDKENGYRLETNVWLVSTKNGMYKETIKIWAIIFVVETFLVIVSTAIFSKKLKAVAKRNRKIKEDIGQ